MAKDSPRSRVFLIARDMGETIVDQWELSYDDYYEGTTPVIDSDEYRSTRGIRYLEGEVYGSKGNLQKKFVTKYDERGMCIGGRAVHEDGTVIEN
jgi:hypothetical protein